jgi:hypothetical protein
LIKDAYRGLLVDDQTREAALAAMRGRGPGHRSEGLGSSLVACLRGLAVCGRCGAAMVVSTGTGRNGRVHGYYKCGRAQKRGRSGCVARPMSVAAVDEAAVDALIGALDCHGDELLEAYSRHQVAAASRADGADQRIKRARLDLAAASRRTDLLLDLYEGWKMAKDAAVARLDELGRERQRLEREIAAEEAAISAAGTAADDVAAVLDLIGDAVALLRITNDPDHRAGVIGSFVASATLHEDRLEIGLLAPGSQSVSVGSGTDTLREPGAVVVALLMRVCRTKGAVAYKSAGLLIRSHSAASSSHHAHAAAI